MVLWVCLSLLLFVFPSTMSILPSVPDTENSVAFFSGFEDCLVLNLIFSSFFSIKFAWHFLLFFFLFLFSCCCICKHTVLLSRRCDVLCMSFLVDWGGKSYKELVSSERSYALRNAHWWQCWWTTMDGLEGASGGGIQERTFFFFFFFTHEAEWRAIFLFVTVMCNLEHFPLHEEICYSNQNLVPFYKPL